MKNLIQFFCEWRWMNQKFSSSTKSRKHVIQKVLTFFFILLSNVDKRNTLIRVCDWRGSNFIKSVFENQKWKPHGLNSNCRWFLWFCSSIFSIICFLHSSCCELRILSDFLIKQIFFCFKLNWRKDFEEWKSLIFHQRLGFPKKQNQKSIKKEALLLKSWFYFNFAVCTVFVLF